MERLTVVEKKYFGNKINRDKELDYIVKNGIVSEYFEYLYSRKNKYYTKSEFNQNLDFFLDRYQDLKNNNLSENDSLKRAIVLTMSHMFKQY